MGVPAFYRWLCTRFPMAISDALESQTHVVEGKEEVVDDELSVTTEELNLLSKEGVGSNGEEEEVTESDQHITTKTETKTKREGVEYEIPVDFEEANPNGIEFDNLYLDLNGIIHPCSRPTDGPLPKNEKEVFTNIMKCMDRLISVVRPRKLLYIAIDGVAPRAKMNHQRCRRFRAVQEARQEEEEARKLIEEMSIENPNISMNSLYQSSHGANKWDSNVITPGTPFLHRVSKMLKWYIADRMGNNPLWKLYRFRVILSDANCPGEGEHKIIHFIRGQRSVAFFGSSFDVAKSKNISNIVKSTNEEMNEYEMTMKGRITNSDFYNPNLSHVIYGADADLIMLGLATHEISCFVIREGIPPQVAYLQCYICGRKGHLAAECTGDDTADIPPQSPLRDEPDEDDSTPEKIPFQLVNISVLREYFAALFTRSLNGDDVCLLPFSYDFERVIDDFVLLCFFVGNDFLPHLPSMSIHDGSIDQLICLYLEILPTLDDYLSKEGKINLQNFEIFIEYLGKMESETFRRRLFREDRLSKQRQSGQDHTRTERTNRRRSLAEDTNITKARRLLAECTDALKNKNSDIIIPESNVNGECVSVTEIQKGEDISITDENTNDESVTSIFTKVQEAAFQNSLKQRIDAIGKLGNSYPDVIRLGEDDDSVWKQRYYTEKFHLSPEDMGDFIISIRQSYIEGLAWVLLYYYQGCASWTWFYPYHYAPFSSDLIGCGNLSLEFISGNCAQPLEQLLSVLPPTSARASGVPQKLMDLMTTPTSPIADFYPSDFAVDINGKKFMWLAVVLMPYIDADRLRKVVNPVLQELYTEIEGYTLKDSTTQQPSNTDINLLNLRERNSANHPLLFVHSSDSLYSQMKNFRCCCVKMAEIPKGEELRTCRETDITTHSYIEDKPWYDPNGHGSPIFGALMRSQYYNISDLNINYFSSLKELFLEDTIESVLTGFAFRSLDECGILCTPFMAIPDEPFSNVELSTTGKRYHVSSLLRGIVEPKHVLSNANIADMSNLKGFGGNFARNCLISCLEKLGMSTRQKYVSSPRGSGPPPPRYSLQPVGNVQRHPRSEEGHTQYDSLAAPMHPNVENTLPTQYTDQHLNNGNKEYVSNNNNNSFDGSYSVKSSNPYDTSVFSSHGNEKDRNQNFQSRSNYSPDYRGRHNSHNGNNPNNQHNSHNQHNGHNGHNGHSIHSSNHNNPNSNFHGTRSSFGDTRPDHSRQNEFISGENSNEMNHWTKNQRAESEIPNTNNKLQSVNQFGGQWRNSNNSTNDQSHGYTNQTNRNSNEGYVVNNNTYNQNTGHWPRNNNHEANHVPYNSNKTPYNSGLRDPSGGSYQQMTHGVGRGQNTEGVPSYVGSMRNPRSNDTNRRGYPHPPPPNGSSR